jgi:hypothetical protein
MWIDKILIYFSSKIAGADYFGGITKPIVTDVLEHLKNIGYLEFDNTYEIFKQIYVKDWDVKFDMKLCHKDKEDLIRYNKELKDRFQGSPDHFHSYDSEKKGFNITTYKREIATLAKPFLKFYDKSRELTTKSNDFFNTLPVEIQQEVVENLIYRYEFTLKDKTYFSKFGLSNRLEDVLEITQEKWKEIGRYFLNTNFQVKVRKPIDTSKLKPIELLLCLHFIENFESGQSVDQIRNKYISVHTNKTTRNRMKNLFDRIYYHSTVGEKAVQAQDVYKMITKWDKYFGLIK